MTNLPKRTIRKKTKIRLYVKSSEGEGLKEFFIPARTVSPLIIHRAVEDCSATPPTLSSRWQVTHEYTGLSCGIQGSYAYCKAMLEELIKEPVMYMLSSKMMTSHPQYQEFINRFNEYRIKHHHLGQVW
jgi:hypothetical protein